MTSSTGIKITSHFSISRIPRLWKQHADFWTGMAVVLAVLILLPLVALFYGMAQSAPEWGHVVETVLTGYIWNTVWLTVAVAGLSVLMAVPAAWLLSHFHVPGRKFFEWAMVLPMAVPTYVAAFVYKQVPEASIPLLVRIREAYGVDAFLWWEALIRQGMLALLMASVLYPYLYLSLRTAFTVQRRGMIEAAQLLGRRPGSVFFTVALPMARPALIAGISLISMEVLNDYGAVYFMGVPTLTVGVFRTWTGLRDLHSAVRLAGIMILAVFSLLFFESKLRGRARFHESGGDSSPIQRRPLRPLSRVLGVLACLIPLTLGFILPLLQLLYWAWISLTQRGDSLPWQRMLHSLSLALVMSVVLTVISLLLVYAQRIHPLRGLTALIRMAGTGYAVPGAVVAVGVMMVFATGTRLGMPTLIGTMGAVGFGYIVRFLAVGIHPLRAGMDRICGSLDDASRTLGHRPAATLWHINLPLLRGTLLTVTMLVFVDILKELPMTMILRPADFDTLATLAFGLANEARIQECAIPSLLIILIAGIGLYSLNHLWESKTPERPL